MTQTPTKLLKFTWEMELPNGRRLAKVYEFNAEMLNVDVMRREAFAREMGNVVRDVLVIELTDPQPESGLV